MKKTGVLHAQLSRIIAAMAHGDMLVIGDAGLPVPPGVEFVDLALKEGVPGFLETVETVLTELHVEEAIIDTEQAEVSPQMYKALLQTNRPHRPSGPLPMPQRWPQPIQWRDLYRRR